MKKEQKGALGGGDNIIGAIAPPNFLELEFPLISPALGLTLDLGISGSARSIARLFDWAL